MDWRSSKHGNGRHPYSESNRSVGAVNKLSGIWPRFKCRFGQQQYETSPIAFGSVPPSCLQGSIDRIFEIIGCNEAPS
jgi:hypothetical protein